MTRLLVTGDRYWTDYEAILGYLVAAQEQGITVVIEGEAEGADKLARNAAGHLGLDVEAFPADWNVYPTTPLWAVGYRRDGTPYNRLAGPQRNQQMLDEGQPDRAVAFHPDLSRSRGTLDMIQRVEKAGIPLEFVPHDTRPERAQLGLGV